MDQIINSVKLSLAKIDPQVVKMALVLLSLLLFVLGAGAPAVGGGINGH